MVSRSPTLLARLRRHRGLWVLVVAAMLIKLASSTLCLADGLGLGTSQGWSTANMALVAAAEHAASASDDGCVLGEGGSCHCACAHAAMLPAAFFMAATFPPPDVAPSPAPPGSISVASAYLLRPPIA